MKKSSTKKAKILRAAKECLARYGYEKTTMDDIGRLVGLNKASLYYYYKNKESLFSEVIINETEEFIAALQQKVNQVAGCENRIKTYLVERLRYYRKVINLHNLSIETLNNVQPQFHRLYQSVLDQEIGFITALLDQGVADDQIKPCDTRRVAVSILTVSDAIKHQTLLRPEDFPLGIRLDYSRIEAEVCFTVGLILAGLR
jgi:AcrR family transcriptional regulator